MSTVLRWKMLNVSFGLIVVMRHYCAIKLSGGAESLVWFVVAAAVKLMIVGITMDFFFRLNSAEFGRIQPNSAEFSRNFNSYSAEFG